METCAKHLGISTQKALDFTLKCSDHHKTWQILEIVYIAFTKELLVPYVEECVAQNMNDAVSAQGYWEWSQDTTDPKYHYIQQMVFTYLHAAMMFRDGCRKGDGQQITMAKRKLAPLVFGGNQTGYELIMCHDLIQDCIMPANIKDILNNSLTASRTGNVGHYQGGDAMLEEVNKESKSWIPCSGVPSDHHWSKVFRNLEKLNRVSWKSVTKKITIYFI